MMNPLYKISFPALYFTAYSNKIDFIKIQRLQSEALAFVRNKKKGLAMQQDWYFCLFKIAYIAIFILHFSTPSFAQNTLQNNNHQQLQGIQLGVFSNKIEAKKISKKLQGLKFDTRIIPLQRGYMVAAGAFSSKSNIDRALKRLASAGLSDKVHVTAIESKNRNNTPSVKPKLARSTLVESEAEVLQNEYVPKEEYDKLAKEVELLKAQMKILLERTPSTETHIAEAAPKPSPSEEKPKTEKKSSIDEGSREEEAADLQRQLDTFLRREKVLFKRGELEFEFGLSYAQSSSRAACFNPKAGSEFCQKDRNLALSNRLDSLSVDTRFSLSYGIADDLALALSFPYSYSEQESDTAPFTINNERVVNHNSFIGIGDISGSLRYTAFHEGGNIPGVAVNINAKAPTGNEKKRLGSGFWNVGAGVSLTKTIDPVVFFGSLGYTATLPSGGVDLGDQISYSLGGGFSLNDRVSVAVALSGSAILRNEIDGKEIPGSSQNISSLQFSSTVKLSRSLFVEPFVAFGLTEEANDFIFGINVPYRFEDKYPLPFSFD